MGRCVFIGENGKMCIILLIRGSPIFKIMKGLRAEVLRYILKDFKEQ